MGTWGTPGNWSGGTYSGGVVSYDDADKKIVLTGLQSTTSVPVSTSDVTIAPANDAAVTGPSAAASINTLQLGNGTNTYQPDGSVRRALDGHRRNDHQ